MAVILEDLLKLEVDDWINMRNSHRLFIDDRLGCYPDMNVTRIRVKQYIITTLQNTDYPWGKYGSGNSSVEYISMAAIPNLIEAKRLMSL